jgi:hypothetical protein
LVKEKGGTGVRERRVLGNQVGSNGINWEEERKVGKEEGG